MADDYKASSHWQALNRIWKALPVSAREERKDDFRLITDMVKEKSVATADQPEAHTKVEYGFENRFLAGMSKATKAYALTCLTQEHTDIYKTIMDFIVENSLRDMDNLWEKYTSDINITTDDESAVREIMCICLERARIQGLV